MTYSVTMSLFVPLLTYNHFYVPGNKNDEALFHYSDANYKRYRQTDGQWSYRTYTALHVMRRALKINKAYKSKIKLNQTENI